jgi:FMN-dependent NADH-azoreductase
MKSLLVLDSSGRVTRSITRRLTRRFVSVWQQHHPAGRVVRRDLGVNPPPTVNESWIAAAFADPTERTDAMQAALALSEELIDELVTADAIVIGTPIYNFGAPAALKAYFDQIVRVGRTFAFAPGESKPYRPLLASRPVIVITSAGDGAMLPGGALASLNFLDPHLEAMFGFIGLADVTFVRVGYDEFKDARWEHSLAAAEARIDALASAPARHPAVDQLV